MAEKVGEKNGMLTQEEMDKLLKLDSFIADRQSHKNSLIEEIHEAILNSGRLSLIEWKSLRRKLKEIEEIIPHIDLIVKLKEKSRKNS